MTTLIFFAEPERQDAHQITLDQDWTGTEWRLSRDRGGAGAEIEREVGDDDVIELVLEDGTTLFLTADQLGDYGYRPSRFGAGIEIGPWLQAPDAPSRDGVGAWALRSLRLWRNPAGLVMHTAAGTLQDRILGQRLGWYRFGDRAQAVEQLDGGVPGSVDPALLLIHGTLSSTAGSFGGLLSDTPLHGLRELYGERIYGFEHRTLTDSPLANALALAEGLPADLTVDVITHSRGGLVAELLVRAADLDGGGFSDQDIDLFHARADGKVADEYAKGLRLLRTVVTQKNLRIRRLVRVAAPMRGTTLLSGRLDRWVAITFELLGKGLELSGRPEAAGIVNALKSFLLALTRQRTLPDVLAGLEAMRPESAWVELLNPPEHRVQVPTFVIAGDYQGKGLVSWLADRFSDSYYGGANDWVVNTVSMTGGARRSAGLYRRLFRDSDTRHTTYFDREVVRSRILAALSHGTAAEGFDRVERETAAIDRGGRKDRHRPGAPIALLLPGITGSHLQVGSDRIWLQPHELLLGNLRRLNIDAEKVAPDGWIDSAYEGFADYLAKSHEVRPFAYDWRLSIADSGKQFASKLQDALSEAERRKQPVHIFAHSMGGLVARWALGQEGLWNRFEDRSGSRLVMLGTPNGGSHSIPWLLMGREKTLRLLGRWDFRHGPRELVDLFRRYPGILQLMPFGGTSSSDFFQPDYWARISSDLKDKAGQWPVPHQSDLAESRMVLEALAAAPLRGRPVAYVAGFNPQEGTIESINPGQAPEPAISRSGDGRVLWSTGIPAEVTTYYAREVHGDLAKYKKAFDGYRELAERGVTTSPFLSNEPPAASTGSTFSRSGSVGGSAAAAESLLLFPTLEEVLAAAMGGRPERAGVSSEDQVAPVRIQMIHGSFATARGAIMVGRYEEDAELGGAPRVLDSLLGGALRDALRLGCLPARRDSTLIFEEDALISGLGAIVVGLGRLGELTSGELRQILARGLREYVLKRWRTLRADADARIDIASVLVGSGSFGLSIGAAVVALVQAAIEVQSELRILPLRNGRRPLIGTLRIYEIDESRAEHAAAAVESLRRERQHANFDFDGRILRGEHGQRLHLNGGADADAAQRVVIRAPDGIEHGLEFTVISASARSDFVREPDQGKFVKRMLQLAIGSTADQPGLSRALFELLTPNSYKSEIGNIGNLVLNVDEQAAGIPWELMRDQDKSGRPLATRVSIIRQLVRSAKETSPRARLLKAVVIGDTVANPKHYPRLDGARAEMKAVRVALETQGIDVVAREAIPGLDLLELLLTQEIGILHIAAHGDWVRAPTEVEHGDRLEGAADWRQSGVVLGDGLLLTSSQIAKLPWVPELVFLNCCHLGNTVDERARTGPWPDLAASLAVAFIDRGAKVVVAAGWAVNDAAALKFAEVFYGRLLSGDRLGAAVLAARKATHDAYPAANTWGAYQVYGDESYRPLLIVNGKKAAPKPPESINTRLKALDEIHSLIGRRELEESSKGSDPAPADGSETVSDVNVDKLLQRLIPDVLDDAEVRAALGRAYLAMGNRSEAIQQWRCALTCKDAALPLRDLEQLANLETREAACTVGADEAKARRLLNAGVARIESLMAACGPTPERKGLLGSARKREAWVKAVIDRAKAKPLTALSQAIDAYRDAVDIAGTPAEELYHYPANNLAHLRWLHAALRSELSAELAAELRMIALAARRNAERRSENGGDFWDCAAMVDCALTEALADACEQHPRHAGDATRIAERLIASVNPERIEVRRRFGNSYKNASPREQLQFFVVMFRWCTESKEPGAASAREWQLTFEALLGAFDHPPLENVRFAAAPTQGKVAPAAPAKAKVASARRSGGKRDRSAKADAKQSARAGKPAGTVAQKAKSTPTRAAKPERPTQTPKRARRRP